ncbi:unnamed protein product [Toxocara canis]|uniref:LETM1 domain-containing protein n=1 Tax=Toxocara canis TaxID=6265 RepID=A0A183UIE6_TOXCA|nr:unnamed protein product [Toxocara canis]
MLAKKELFQGLVFTNRVNHRRYAISRLPVKVQKFYDNKRILSLSEKFQLRENLRSFEASRYLLAERSIIHVFGITSSNPFVANVLLEIFDIFVATYAIVVPIIGAHCNPVWMREFCRLIYCFPWRLRIKKNVYPLISRSTTYDPKAVAERYFQQLNIEWNQ